MVIEVLTTDEERVDSLVDELLEEFPPASTPAVDFLGEQFDRGSRGSTSSRGVAASG